MAPAADECARARPGRAVEVPAGRPGECCVIHTEQQGKTVQRAAPVLRTAGPADRLPIITLKTKYIRVARSSQHLHAQAARGTATFVHVPERVCAHGMLPQPRGERQL